MKEFNFSPVTYNGLGQRRDNYFDNLRKGISTLASTPKNAYNRWYDEEENKRKWDHMLDEQRYRRERDQIADQSTMKSSPALPLNVVPGCVAWN